MKISVITASYNCENTIRDTIESVLNQTYQDWELIVVDDGSKDNSIDVINTYCQKDSRIKLYTHKDNKNKGLAETIKLGLKYAESEWIHFVECDDILKPNAIEEKVKIIEKYENVGLVFSEVEMFGDENAIDESYNKDYMRNRIKIINEENFPAKIIKKTYSINLIPTFSCVMCKKENLLNCSFDTPIDAYLDWFLWSQMADKYIYYTPEQLTMWRINYTSYGKLFKELNNLILQKKYLLAIKLNIKQKSKFIKQIKLFLFDFKQILQNIFSIGNSSDKKHKIIKILGIKLKIKKKPKLKDKLAYYEYIESYKNQSKNDFVPITDKAYNNINTVKPIAFYLPQFHSIPLNDENFGKGFTEWTNVTKAIPQFEGHYQPQLPIDVGFYDLSNDDVMCRQIELAKMYGIFGFCFHYYWFSGKRLLEKPIFNWLNNKELNLPFCLCWANENWSKLWDGGNREIMMEQKLEDGDDEKFFYDILPFFKDERYIKIDNKPILIIYRLNLFEETRINIFVKNIKELALKEGFDGIYLIGAKAFNCLNPQQYGADAAVEFPPLQMNANEISKKYINKNFVGKIIELDSYIKEKKYMNDDNPKLYKTLFPGWDNTARKAKSNATVFLCNPELYKAWLSDLVKWTKTHHKKEDQFVFINAWNEWGEGAHLEPDQRFGYAYLQATKDVLEEIGD